jgi:ankyrin
VYTVAAEEMGNVVSEELYNLSTTGNEEKIKKLLIANRGRLHINWKNPLKHYRTALHAATRHCHLNIVKLLLQWKAKTNIRDSFGWCPLDYACSKGYLDIVDVLTDHPNWTGSAGRTIYNETPLHIACRYEHVAVVRLLLQKGAKVYVNARSSGRNTPLHFAVLKQNTEIVRMLLANGASHHIVNMVRKSIVD